MVKVKLMENKVKSHVGSVMVVKVMIQYSAPGSTVRMLSTTRASRPNVEEEAVFSTGGAVCRTSATAATVWDRLVATELEACMASAAAVAMVDGGGERRAPRTEDVNSGRAVGKGKDQSEAQRGMEGNPRHGGTGGRCGGTGPWNLPRGSEHGRVLGSELQRSFTRFFTTRLTSRRPLAHHAALQR